MLTTRESDWLAAQPYWDTAARTYERDFSSTLIGQTRREAVWKDLDALFYPGQRIIELGCGTGIDALHLAQRGIRVLACDLSPAMVEIARQRLGATAFRDAVEFRVLANEEVGRLLPEGPFDGAFSNFASLNCTSDLPSVAPDLAGLLRPEASLLTSMIGRFVPWEIAWRLLHREPRRAFERFKRGVIREVEGGTVRVRYLGVSQIAHAFAPNFLLRRWRGIGIAVPPSYLEHWALRFPDTIRSLADLDDRIGRWPAFRRMADAFVLELKRSGSHNG